MIGFLQIAIAIMRSQDIPWPTAFVSFMQMFSFMNFDFVPWDSLGCVYTFPYFYKAVIVICMPPAIMCMLCMVFFIPMYIMDRRDMSDNDKYRNKRARSQAQMFKIIIFTTFLFYPYVNTVLLGMFNCIDIYGTRYMVADFTMDCASSEYQWQAAVIAPFAMFYSIGIPVLEGHFLYRNRMKLRDPDMLLKAGFIYEAFDRNCWYFEIVDMLHKLVQTSLIPFLPNNMEMPATMFVAIVFVIVLLLKSPFIRKGDDRLKLLTLINLAMLAMVGFVIQRLQVIRLPELEDTIYGILLVSIVIVMLLSGVLITVKNLRKILAHVVRKKRDRKQMEMEMSIRDPDKNSFEGPGRNTLKFSSSENTNGRNVPISFYLNNN